MKPSKEVILKSGSVYLGVVAVLCCIEIIWACGKDDAAEKPSRDVCGSLSEMHGTLVCSHLISDKNTWVALTVRPGGFDKIALTKYVMTADDTLRVPLSFMNANIHPLHYDFLIDAFPEVFDGVSPVQYLRMATNGDTRSLIVGDIALYIEGGKTFYGFTILDDSANPKKVIRHNQAQHLYRELSSSFTIGELTFVPNTSAQIQATKSWPADIPIVGLEEIEYEVYTIGEGFGTVRILDPHEFQTASASGEIGFQDILVLDEAPIDLERIVSGTVTGIRDAEVDENLLDSLKRLILEIFKSDTVMVRFRSSSNAEDAISFSGAGLYDSESACLADETDGDTIGPSHCDSDQRNERELSRALKKVWASLWNPTAYEERSWYGVDHLQTAMGIFSLVTQKSGKRRRIERDKRGQTMEPPHAT